MTPESYVIGIDVGTGSARAGIFDLRGNLLAAEKHDIKVYYEGATIVEQSSENIWKAICKSVRAIMQSSGIAPDAVKGIGVDATCSLVVLDKKGMPLSVSNTGQNDRNIIVWMDHRATDQAARINALAHPVLRYVGNRISPEMQTPKLLWLKEFLPETFSNAGHFFDLADFITWRSTGSTQRSICTTTCKWTYLAHERRWDESYFHAVGLSELAKEGFHRIGVEVVDVGTAMGNGLTTEAASELGLAPGTPVGAGLIDAHAGGVGTIGFEGAGSLVSRLAYVFGTSACTMTSSTEPFFVPGVWGPYYSAMAPGLWLNEAGQSAAGAAIDYLIQMHPAKGEAEASAKQAGVSTVEWLSKQALTKSNHASQTVMIAEGLHIVPEFLGNRAPFANPDARALIAGLDMDRSIESLVKVYVAGICGLGYGLRQIIAAQASKGLNVSSIIISGGAGQSALVRQLMADTTGLPVMIPATQEPVLLGAAIAGAVAGRQHSSLSNAMSNMSGVSETFIPSKDSVAVLHERRFEAFCRLQKLGQQLRSFS